MEQILTLIESDDSDDSISDEEDEILQTILNISVLNLKLITTECLNADQLHGLGVINNEHFNIILTEYQNVVMESIQFQNEDIIQVLLQNDVVILLEYLSGEYITEIANKYCLNIVFVANSIKRTLKVFTSSDFKRKFMKFPETIVESMTISRAINAMGDLKDVVGIIGITSFPFVANNSKELSLQICIDHQNMIQAIDSNVIGTESEIYDMIWNSLERMNIKLLGKSKLYATSELYTNITSIIPCDNSKYQLFGENMDLIFDGLRNKFRCLNNLMENEYGIDCNNIITAVCILHNLNSF